jgi:hypothetical protein
MSRVERLKDLCRKMSSCGLTESEVVEYYQLLGLKFNPQALYCSFMYAEEL